MKKILLLLLACVPCFAQTTLSIPAHSWTQPVTVNGITVTITLNEPAQTVPVPASGGSALPSGITWSNNVLTVAGTISATSVSLTGGPAIPTCASALYLWQMVSGALQPACYVAPTFTVPPLSLTQSTTAANTFTVTP